MKNPTFLVVSLLLVVLQTGGCAHVRPGVPNTGSLLHATISAPLPPPRLNAFGYPSLLTDRQHRKLRALGIYGATRWILTH